MFTKITCNIGSFVLMTGIIMIFFQLGMLYALAAPESARWILDQDFFGVALVLTIAGLLLVLFSRNPREKES